MMPSPSTAAGTRRQRRLKLSAALCWAGAAAGIVFLTYTVLSGRLTIINLSVLLLVIVSLGAFGLLALSGDLAWSAGALDEGQIAASQSAQSPAFYLAYLGIIGLWMAYLFVPAWAGSATVHLGILAVAITLVWFGGWVWRRWRP